MRLGVTLFIVLLASCGGGGGSPSNAPPPLTTPPAPLELSVPGKAVVKIRVAASGTTVMEERLQPLTHAGGPDRSLEIFDASGALTGRFTPPPDFALIDFAQHPAGEITLALATAKSVTLVRLSRSGTALDQMPVIDPQAATDRFYDEGGVRDDNSLLPVLTRDAVALAPLGEGVVMALRTGRNATVAYRYDHAGVFTKSWRTLVEPGLTVLGIGITSGTFDTFAALENHMHVALDVDDAGNIAIAVGSNAFAARLFAAHADYFSQPTTAVDGAIVTRLAPDGRRLGATIVDTVQPSELHGLRLAGDDIAIVGRVFTQRRDDGGGWDAFAAHVSRASGNLAGYRAIDVDRGDILFDIAALGDGRYLAVGAAGYTQNPDGASVSEQASALAVVLDADGAVRTRIAIPAAPRNNQARSIVSSGSRWMAGGQSNGPGTHSGDGAPAAISADGFVRELVIPRP
jgi:hypothetical protein